MISVQLDSDTKFNVVSNFLIAVYVGAVEAKWRTCELSMSEILNNLFF